MNGPTRLRRLPPEEQLLLVKDLFERTGLLPPGSNLAHVRGFVEVFRQNQATRYYPARPVPVPIVLFRSGQEADPVALANVPASILEDPALGWGAFASAPVEVCRVPGDHLTMMAEPHVRVLAARLAACLADHRPGRRNGVSPTAAPSAGDTNVAGRGDFFLP